MPVGIAAKLSRGATEPTHAAAKPSPVATKPTRVAGGLAREGAEGAPWAAKEPRDAGGADERRGVAGLPCELAGAACPSVRFAADVLVVEVGQTAARPYYLRGGLARHMRADQLDKGFQVAALDLRPQAREGCQFLVATHAPIVLSYPGAWLYELDEHGLRRVEYDETSTVKVTRQFLGERGPIGTPRPSHRPRRRTPTTRSTWPMTSTVERASTPSSRADARPAASMTSRARRTWSSGAAESSSTVGPVPSAGSTTCRNRPGPPA